MCSAPITSYIIHCTAVYSTLLYDILVNNNNNNSLFELLRFTWPLFPKYLILLRRDLEHLILRVLDDLETAVHAFLVLESPIL